MVVSDSITVSDCAPVCPTGSLSPALAGLALKSLLVMCSREISPLEMRLLPFLTRPGKLSRRRLEFSACVVRLVPVLRHVCG